MFECKIIQNVDNLFTPFVLNMRITTRQSARDLFQLLKPIVSPGVIQGEVNLTEVNKDQQEIAEDICNILFANIADIDGF